MKYTIFIITLTFILGGCSLAMKGAAERREIQSLQINAEMGYQWGHMRPCKLLESEELVWEYGDRHPTGIAICGSLVLHTIEGTPVPFYRDTINKE